MKILIEKEAESFLEKEGFPIVKRAIVKNETQLLNNARKLGFPLALKIISSKILHKTDVGGVKLNLKTEQELIKAFKTLKEIKGFESALLQKYTHGNYVLVGIKKDPTFGHVIAVGLGGIFTEVIKDVSFRVCPLSKKDALDMIKELKAYSILKGIRGKKVNIDSIVNIILKMSDLAKKYQNIKELDINPVVVDEKKAIIVDARIIFE
jgi:acetyl-CoA synthetase (ADP-forming)